MAQRRRREKELMLDYLCDACGRYVPGAVVTDESTQAHHDGLGRDTPEWELRVRRHHTYVVYGGHGCPGTLKPELVMR